MNSIELYVFDKDFNRLGIIDTYEEIYLESNYKKHSELHLTVDGTKENADLLLSDDFRIITKSTDITRGYIVETPQYFDEAATQIEVIAYSLSYMLNWRIIRGQQYFKGNIEDVIKAFVNANAINPNDTNRIIPNLVLGVNDGINITADEAYNNRQLDEALWEICDKYEVSFEILMNHEAKKYVFSTYMGIDRTTEQSMNQPVIFAKAFDNVTKQSYVDDKSNYKSTAYVAGEGEGVERTVVKVNDSLSGFNRRELFVDARDLQSKYRQEDGTEVTIPQTEYHALLQERGQNRLADYQRIRTFESNIDLYSQFIFNEHYFLGDKVTTRNDDLGIVTHSRVVTAKETYTRDGYELALEFGTSIPTLLDKLKREVKR
ncbi:hypothetical protein MTP04_24330 [Lysinibacillus sp. PLM2]|nr:hypothetical protein MTP04_24330 [Lysinibacillus sp. PLM2]